MRWRGRRKSTNVEDRRGRGAGTGMAIGGVGLIIAIVVLLMGGDPTAILQGGGGGQSRQTQQQPYQPTEAEREIHDFVLTVLADTEDVWHEQFRRMGRRYQEPTIVPFTGQVRSACGFASAAVGPFYCPGDQKIYLDYGFFKTLKERLGAPGDFAQAYVIAHEVAHHVQHLLGFNKPLDNARGRVPQKQVNALTVRLELQADFLAGVWAHHAHRTKQILEAGDIEEAMNAAQQIGDDALQKRSQGYVVPDSFTHGTSAQRMAWFKRGLQTGDVRMGDTFNDALYYEVSPP